MKHFALLVFAAFFAISGCGGGGGGTAPAAREVTVKVFWNNESDIDLSATRNNGPFNDPDGISVFNLQGGPPPWGQHGGDANGTTGTTEQIDFTAKESEQPYNIYAHGYLVIGGSATVECQVFLDGSNTPSFDETRQITHDEVIHFAVVRTSGVHSPPGGIKVLVEKSKIRKKP
jgi:hypothetical protein